MNLYGEMEFGSMRIQENDFRLNGVRQTDDSGK